MKVVVIVIVVAIVVETPATDLTILPLSPRKTISNLNSTESALLKMLIIDTCSLNHLIFFHVIYSVQHPSMIPIIPLLRQRPLTLGQNPRLPSHLPQPSKNLLIPLHKPIQRVRNPDLRTEPPHQRLRPPQIMSRDARVQVMDGLELQSAVEEVEPVGTIDVHGRAEHLLGKGLVHAEIGGAHGEVAERDLHVQGRRDHVADQDEGEAAA